jgi:hypothetical protein
LKTIVLYLSIDVLQNVWEKIRLKLILYNPYKSNSRSVTRMFKVSWQQVNSKLCVTSFMKESSGNPNKHSQKNIEEKKVPDSKE